MTRPTSLEQTSPSTAKLGRFLNSAAESPRSKAGPVSFTASDRQWLALGRKQIRPVGAASSRPGDRQHSWLPHFHVDNESPAGTSSHCALVDCVLPGAQGLLWCVCRKGSLGEGRWFFCDRNVSKPYLFWRLGLAFERKADAPSRHFAGKKRQRVTTIRPVLAGCSTSS
jgi:hypothetical protein